MRTSIGASLTLGYSKAFSHHVVMSLLIGARGRDFVVVLTDGISLRKKDGNTKVESRDLQKMFQIGDRPCVLAHHGQNELGQLKVNSVLTGENFQKVQSRAWALGLNVAMARTVNRLDSTVSQTLKSSKERGLFGLWFAGFWPCTGNPEITELVWQQSSPNRVRVSMLPHRELVIGGSGLKFLREFLSKPINKELNPANILREPVEYSMALVKKLYSIAEERQKRAGEEGFGGQRRMAVITRYGVDLGPLD